MRVCVLLVSPKSLDHEWTGPHLGAVVDVLLVVLLAQDLLDASLGDTSVWVSGREGSGVGEVVCGDVVLWSYKQ